MTSNVRTCFTKFPKTEKRVENQTGRVAENVRRTSKCLELWSTTVLCQSVFGISSQSKLLIITGKRRPKVVKLYANFRSDFYTVESRNLVTIKLGT